MEKVIIVLLNGDYTRLKLMLKKPNASIQDSAFKSLLGKASVIERQKYQILVWENIEWDKEEGAVILEGFVSFCPCYRLVRLKDERELLVNASGHANTPEVTDALKIVTDVRY